VSVVTAPTGDMFSAAELQAHLRIVGPQDDLLLQDCVKAAIGEIDAPHGWLGRSLLSRVLRLTLDSAPGDHIYLPGPPVTAVSSITYRDTSNAWITMAATDYDKDLTAEPALVWPISSWPCNVWPSDMWSGTDCVRVQYVAGYANSAAVPPTIKQWLLMRIGELYRDREASMLGTTSIRLPHADAMLEPWRVRA
jgi:uncharacterized phiE125 gp8 family phage protein